MNFTTDLPKRDPLVSYIVASAVKCEKFFPGSNDDGPVYRMHAVILIAKATVYEQRKTKNCSGSPLSVYRKIYMLPLSPGHSALLNFKIFVWRSAPLTLQSVDLCCCCCSCCWIANNKPTFGGPSTHESYASSIYNCQR